MFYLFSIKHVITVTDHYIFQSLYCWVHSRHSESNGQLLEKYANLFANILDYANDSLTVVSDYEPQFWFINPPFLLLEVEFPNLSEFLELQFLNKIISNLIPEKYTEESNNDSYNISGAFPPDSVEKQNKILDSNSLTDISNLPLLCIWATSMELWSDVIRSYYFSSS